MSAHFASTLVNFGKRALPMIMVVFALALAGCSTSSRSTSGYTGPAISSYKAKRTEARSNHRSARKEARSAARKLKKLERSAKRLERKIKRAKDEAKSDLKKALRAKNREIRSAKRAVRRSDRAVARAERRERRAAKAIVTARKRKRAAEQRLAEAKKAEAKRKARLALAKKTADKKTTKKQKPATTIASLFNSNDPAAKYIRDYEARVDGKWTLGAIPVQKLNKRLYRQQVRYRTSHKAGTIVVDTKARFLYLVQRGGKAMRYGIGVGRQGFSWSGTARIGWKAKWPKWTPPDEMIARRPKLEKWSYRNGGMPGGISNPLGARALYLMQGGKDTLFRLHGTPNWASIGTAASSGCIRLINQDVIDLYERVPNGTKVVVL